MVLAPRFVGAQSKELRETVPHRSGMIAHFRCTMTCSNSFYLGFRSVARTASHQLNKRQMELALSIYLILISLRFIAPCSRTNQGGCRDRNCKNLLEGGFREFVLYRCFQDDCRVLRCWLARFVTSGCWTCLFAARASSTGCDGLDMRAALRPLFLSPEAKASINCRPIPSHQV